MGKVSNYKLRRMVVVLLAVFSILAGVVTEAAKDQTPSTEAPATLGISVTQVNTTKYTLASEALNSLAVKGRAPKTGYARTQFSNDWGEINNCSIRELILLRDLTDTRLDEDGCRVLSGTLSDPYTATTIAFNRGATSSQAVQIDHIVAVSDAWQKGAQQLTPQLRYDFYNDPLNLIAVDGPTNNKKSDSDAASWLPPNKEYRCRYVARQIAVKVKYTLWVTDAEKNAMSSLLQTCPDQLVR